MPSKSKSQQRLFGWVHACQTGSAKNCPPSIAKIAGSISHKDAEDFARTKHDGLPERKEKTKKKGKKMKKKRKLKSYVEFREVQILKENLSQAQKGMAGVMLGGDTQQIPPQFVQLMYKMLASAEKKLGVNNNAQAGEEASEWNPQAIQLVQQALSKASSQGGKTLSQQWKGIKSAQKQAQKQSFNQQAAGNPQAMGNMMNPSNASVAQGSVGQQSPTPLNQL